jgi:hypothetical protein
MTNDANAPVPEPVRLHLKNGVEILSGWYDEFDPDAQPAGDFLTAYFPNGSELCVGWDQLADPVTGRKTLSDFLVRCAQGH